MRQAIFDGDGLRGGAAGAAPARSPDRPQLDVLQVGKFYFPRRGGMETHLRDLCNGIRHHANVEVVVANETSKTSVEAVDGIPVTRAGTVCNVAGAQVCPAMTALIRRSRAAVVHMHLPNPTAIMAYLASRHGGHLVFTYHSDIIRQKFLGALFEPVLRQALDRSAAIIVSSVAYVESSPVLGRFRDRCRVVPFGVRPEEYENRNPLAVAAIRERYGSPLVISVGRLVYYKGLKFLLAAMRSVRARLLIIGEGPLRPKLERQAEALGLRDRVFFLGRVDDVVPYYHAADLFVLPSIARSEAFGLVQLEAMACGKPVINTQLATGVPFVSVHERTGLTVTPRDSASLGDAINSLLDDPQRRLSYGAAAKQRVQDEFSLPLMIKRTLGVYAEVADMPQPVWASAAH